MNNSIPLTNIPLTPLLRAALDRVRGMIVRGIGGRRMHHWVDVTAESVTGPSNPQSVSGQLEASNGR